MSFQNSTPVLLPAVRHPSPIQTNALVRVLVVDDEEPVLRVVRRVLEGPCSVTTELSALAAFDRLRRGEQYDVVICDLWMPEMTGVAFHQQLVQLRPELAVRTIFLTGAAFSGEAAEYLASLRNAHVVGKPFDLDGLKPLVAELAAKHRSA